ncbi:MAG: ArsR/SmtB family transcription factor [Pseudomonadota bacterium]
MNSISPHQLCKCLGDETRFHLAALLARHGELCVCDLVDALAAPQSTVSRHLAQLRQCGVVSVRRQGQWMHYRINPDLPEWSRSTLDTLCAPAVLPDLPEACCSAPALEKDIA